VSNAGASVAGIELGLAVPINAATRQVIAALMTEGRFRRAYRGVALGTRRSSRRRLDRRARPGRRIDASATVTAARGQQLITLTLGATELAG
jgi:hypothetical protein